ncbi:MAG: ankyrin repeat domain-containing protein, partial [Maricaulaceae bacterium]
MIDSGSILETVLVFVGNHAWQSALLALALAALFASGARLSASTRHALAVVAFLAALVLPLAALLPGVGLDRVAAPMLPEASVSETSGDAARPTLIPMEAREQAQRTVVIAGDNAAAAAPAPAAAPAAAAPIERPTVREAAPARASAPVFPVVQAAAARTLTALRDNWAAILFAVWGAGAGVLLVRMISHALAGERLRQRARTFTPPAFLPDRLRRLRMKRSDEVGGPMVAGLLRPTVILPSDALARYAEHELIALLEHERAHIERGDLVLACVQRIVIALTWWNPAMHWINRRINDECEAACDDAAATVVGDARAFANALTANARAQLTMGPARLAVGAMHGRSQLARRVRRLMDHVGTPSRVAARIGVAALTLVIVASAFATPRLVAQEANAAPATADRSASARHQQQADESNDSYPEPAWMRTLTRGARAIAANNGDSAADFDRDDVAAALAAIEDEFGANAPLVNAALAGDQRTFDALIEGGADYESDKPALLIAAVMSKDLGLVNRMLVLGADADPVYEVGNSPVVVAVYGGDREIVETLIAAGADIGDREHSVLAAAIWTGEDELIESLIERGAALTAEAVNAAIWKHDGALAANLMARGAPTDEGALHAAIWTHDAALVEALVDAGARAGAEALAAAVWAGDEDLVERLVDRGAEVNPANPEGDTPLVAAIMSGRAGMVELLLDAGTAPDARAQNALRTLRWGARGEIVELLRDAGLDVSAAEIHRTAADERWGRRGDRDRENALERAIRSGDHDLVQELIDDGDESVYAAALEAAISVGDTDIAEALIELLYDQGEDLESEALEAAIFAGERAVAELLIERGVELEPDALEAAIHADERELAFALVELFAERGVEIESDALEAAIWQGDLELAEALFEAGLELQPSLLEAAIANGDDELIDGVLEALLEAGLEIESDALEAAIWEGDLDLAERLFEAGAELQPSLLEAAIANGDDELIDAVLEALLEAGLEIEADALEAAIFEGDHDLVERLVEAGVELDSDALEAAIHSDDEELAQAIAETLIGRDAWIDSDALEAAIIVGYSDLAAMLIEAGVEADRGVLFLDDDEDEDDNERRNVTVVDEDGRVRVVETEVSDVDGRTRVVPRQDGRI